MNHYARMTQAVADYFKDDPHIAGYEIINEPWAGSTWLSTIFGNSFYEAQQLTPFYNQVSAAIRSVDPTTPFIYEPNTLFNEAVPTQLGAVDDPHGVFAFHDYCMLTSISAALSPLCPDYIELLAENGEAYTTKYGVPGLISEFGSGNGAAEAIMVMNAADQRMWGWSQWAYNGVPAITGTAPGNALVFDPGKPPVGDNVDWSGWKPRRRPTRRPLPAPRPPGRSPPAPSSSATLPRWPAAQDTSLPAPRPKSRYHRSSSRTAIRCPSPAGMWSPPWRAGADHRFGQRRHHRHRHRDRRCRQPTRVA